MKSLKYWTPNEFETSSLTFKFNRKKINLATDDSGLCTYTYNELGFRGDSIYKKGFKVMSIGLVPNAIDLNSASSGESNDYINRCLLTYFDLIKPNLVLIMYTSPQRREVYTKGNGIKPFIPGSTWGYLKETEDGRKIQNYLTEIQNDNQDLINWYKNHLLIKLFLESKKCNWIWNGYFNIPKEYHEFNRFDGEYGNFVDYGTDGGHPGPQHNKIYAEKLFKHIETNFPNYLPNENQTYTSNLI